jgi:hypothetical protein
MPTARLRPPAEHRGILAIPSLEQAAQLLALNQARLCQPIRLLDRSLVELRTLCKQEAYEAAQNHVRSLGLSSTIPNHQHWLVSGHQPELYHPGVWVKNFATFGVAQRHGWTPLHFVVDNDAVKSTSIRVPAPAAKPMRTVAVPFDAPGEPVPWEERAVLDSSLLARFPAAVADAMAGASFRPFLPRLWQHVTASQAPRLGLRLAGARRQLEADWGCHNLELPMSRLCQGNGFAYFVLNLLDRLPEFYTIHNQCLRDYRQARGIRSRNHPVPDLAREGSWLEAPFWGWHTGSTTRQRLFARQGQGVIELRLAEEPLQRLPSEGAPERRLAEFRAIEAAGTKIRTRALTTTLFVRLFLADLFIHGIGGAIYDGLTDEIIRRFYGLEPPAFITLSATMHLPLVPWHGAADNEHRIRRRLRDLQWNPQRYLPTLEGPQEARGLLREKERLIAWNPDTANQRKQRFQQLRRVTTDLLPFLKTQRRLLESTLARLGELTATEATARDRSFAYCLHPEAELKNFMTPFLSSAS